MSSSATSGLPANPFSQWKSTVNLNPKKIAVSNLPDEIATLIFSKMAIEQVRVIVENTETKMDRYSLYRSILDVRSSLTGKELAKFQSLLSTEGQAPFSREAPMTQSGIALLTELVFSVFQYLSGNTTYQGPLRPWSDLLADKPMSLSELQRFDLSDSTDISNADLIALTKKSKKLTKLILPGAFPSKEVMAVLKTNCPQAAIYPSAMTEQEWSNPRRFMRKLPPPPQEVANFIKGPRPIWEGKTASQAHMIVPRVNKIVRNIDGHTEIVPWTLKNVDALDKATGGVGCSYVRDKILQLGNDTPPEVGFEWVVFTKDVLPRSRKQACHNQVHLVEHWGYEMPGFLDATTCMLWKNRLSGNRIYGDNPITYTRCKEKIEDWQLAAGEFEPDGVCVDYYRSSVSRFIGVGGLWKCKV